jgi:hypothetical protein
MTDPASPVTTLTASAAPGIDSSPDLGSPTAVTDSPDAILRSLGTTAYELFEVFVLGRNAAASDRLERRAQLVAGPYDGVSELRGRDLLVRGHIGEGQAFAATLVDGVLVGAKATRERGWMTESSLPGRYAWVVEDGDLPHPRIDQWARRITDRTGHVLPGQAIIRLTPNGVASEEMSLTSSALSFEGYPEGASGEELRSPRFAGDTDLAAVRRGELRLATAGTLQPVPVRSTGDAVAKVQRALIDLGYPLPRFGVDGKFGSELGTAVTAFKTNHHIQPNDPVVGPQTISALDRDIVALDQPPIPPPPPGQPVITDPAQISGSLIATNTLPPSGGQRLCFPVSMFQTPNFASGFGTIAERLIEQDYCDTLGCSAATTYIDKNNPTEYKGFLVAHNPILALPPKAAKLAGMGSKIQRPDLLTDDGVRNEYYEIKPLSISGAAEGLLKIAFIESFMKDLHLPYARGTTYPPTLNQAKDIPMMSGNVLGSNINVILNVTRYVPGILTYGICIQGDLLTLLLKVSIAALLAYIAAALLTMGGGALVVA